MFEISEAWVARVVEEGGYLVLTLLIFIENIFPPIPSEIILPLAGSFVSTGQLNYVLAIIAATIGSLLGAYVIYGVSRWAGVPGLEKYGKYIGIKQKDIERGDAWFNRHGDVIVFFGRLLPGVRSVVSIPAGLAEMPFKRFTILTIAGSSVWNALLIGAGWALGSNWRQVAELIGPLSLPIALIVGTVSLVYISYSLHRLHKKRSARREDPRD